MTMITLESTNDPYVKSSSIVRHAQVDFRLDDFDQVQLRKSPIDSTDVAIDKAIS